jgi:subtilisin inhibitor-like
MNSHPPLATARRRTAVAAVIGGVAVLAAACGSQAAASQRSQSAKKTASSLVISVAAARGATPHRWTLSCDPAGGTHPDAQAACAALASAKHPFAPVAAGIMCPMIASGPQTATITGTWHGQKVSARYSRADGCQTDRWNKLEKVLGQVNPGGPMVPALRSPASGSRASGSPASG